MTAVNMMWKEMLRDVMKRGRLVAPRGINTREVLGYDSVVPMDAPLVTVLSRDLGYRFAPAEAAWILSGDNRLSTIKEYAPLGMFSDDGYTLGGAYGPPLRDQMSYVVDCLLRDRESRQAVASIWRPRPGPTKDVPCTVACQWLIREDRLYCIDTMRSSDAWLGWPYDVFTFSMVSAYIAIWLRSRGVKVTLGDLVLVAGSQHLYEKNWIGATCAVPDPNVHLAYAPLDLGEFAEPDDLMNHLWKIARREPMKYRRWLMELRDVG